MTPQPIETCPRDGSFFILVDYSAGERYPAWWDDRKARSGYNLCFINDKETWIDDATGEYDGGITVDGIDLSLKGFNSSLYAWLPFPTFMPKEQS